METFHFSVWYYNIRSGIFLQELFSVCYQFRHPGCGKAFSLVQVAGAGPQKRKKSTKNGAVAKRKWSNSPFFCGKVVLCSILGYKLLKSLSPKGKNGTAKLGFSGEERSSFLHFPVVEKSILFSGEKDDFSAVPVAVWPSTFSGQRPGRAGTVPVRYWSCPA